MNGIDNIKVEFEDVVGIFPSITSFGFGTTEIVNDNQSYPYLLINTGNTTSSTNALLRSGMPKKRSYSVRVILYDEWDQSSLTLSEKYEELEEVMSQYIAKLYKRSIQNLSVLTFPQTNDFDYAEQQHNDNVVSVGCDIDVYLHVGNCDEGTFTDVNKPTNLAAETSGNDINLAWTDNSSNEDGFYIYRSSSYSSGYVLIGTNSAGDTTFTDSAPTQDVTWFYKVRAFDGSVLSAFSDVATGYVSSGGASSYTYDVYFGGVDTGENVTIDGTDVTININ